MSLPRSPDVSSSTLGWSGTDTPAYHPLSPPRREVERYENRALPQVPQWPPVRLEPLKRHSGVSAFSKEVDDILATPEPVVTPDEGSIYLMLCREATSDNGHAEIVYTGDVRDADKNQTREGLKVNTADVPRGGLETLSSPQPQQKASISKVQKISGLENAPTYRQTTPTGHNSEKKVQRVTGLGVPSEEIEQQGRFGGSTRYRFMAKSRP